VERINVVVWPGDTKEWDVEAIFHLSDGRIFMDNWKDRRVLWDQLHRTRNLYGCPLTWLGVVTTIDCGQTHMEMPE
jgi:hypothetical protein